MLKPSNRDPRFEDGQEIRDRTFEFACGVRRFCHTQQRAGQLDRSFAEQLRDASSSVAAMVEEAKAAESRRDFISKCAIALKEARESLVRLRIWLATATGDRAEAVALTKEANEIVAVLAAIVGNARRNLSKESGSSNRRTNS